MSAILERSNGRSLFWPLLLIGIGLVWLLSNIGILTAANLSMLFRLWPLLLIVIGLQLLVGRGRPALSTVIALAGVAVIIGAMLLGPTLGWASAPEVKQAAYTEPLEDAVSAHVTISPSVAEIFVKPASDAAGLFEADVHYLGELNYDVRGGTERIITLTQKDEPVRVNFWDFNWFAGDRELRWDISLSPAVPLDLEVNGGVSDLNLDLADLQITRLDVNSGVGSLNLSLPAADSVYNVMLNGGTGSMAVEVEEGAALNFEINGGVGEVVLDLPEGVAVRVEASTGVGSIELPANFDRLSGDEEAFVGDEGVWQTAGFDESTRPITIHFQGGVGNFIIR